MSVTLTSAQANKMIKTLNEKINFIKMKEKNTQVFNAAVGEQIEDIRPDYSYSDTQKELDELSRRVRKIKHAINVFNTTTEIQPFGITIDEALVLIPQLTSKKLKLFEMKSRSEKKRYCTTGSIIDYIIANYDISAAEKDYDEVSDYLFNLQNALDTINQTETFEVFLD